LNKVLVFVNTLFDPPPNNIQIPLVIDEDDEDGDDKADEDDKGPLIASPRAHITIATSIPNSTGSSQISTSTAHTNRTRTLRCRAVTRFNISESCKLESHIPSALNTPVPSGLNTTFCSPFNANVTNASFDDPDDNPDVEDEGGDSRVIPDRQFNILTSPIFILVTPLQGNCCPELEQSSSTILR